MRAAARGFTLLEVLVAMVVFLMGVVGILGLFATGLAVHRDAMVRTEAALAADAARAAAEAEIGRLAAAGQLPATIEKTPVPGRPRWHWRAELAVDEERGLAAGVAARVSVATMEGGREKGESFTLFVKPHAGYERSIREAKKSAPALPGGR